MKIHLDFINFQFQRNSKKRFKKSMRNAFLIQFFCIVDFYFDLGWELIVEH